MRRESALIALLVVVLGLTVRSGAAQEGTPISLPLPVAPDPAECRVQPRPLSDVRNLVGMVGGAASPIPVVAWTPVATPSGAPVDDLTAAAVTLTARQFIACLNAGDPARAYALVSDRGLRDGISTMLGAEPATVSLTPVALPQERRLILATVATARLLADGRVGAVVVYDNPNRPPDGPEARFVFFTKQGDHYLIDAVMVLPLNATPAPQPANVS